MSGILTRRSTWAKKPARSRCTAASESPSRCQIAAPTALDSAIWADSAGARSIRPSACRWPPSSTTATAMWTPSWEACSWAPAMTVWASSIIKDMAASVATCADVIFLRMNLVGAVAIVTGGVTGIGRAVSNSLARAGARAVVVNYSRSKDDAEATAASLKALGCEGVAHQESVADDAQVKERIGEDVGGLVRLGL